MSKFRKTEDGEFNEEYQDIDLLRLLKAFWHRAWLIVIAAVICGAAGFSYARTFIAPTYQSSATMYVNNGSFALGGATFSVSDFASSKALVDRYVVFIKTRMMLNEVIERANLNMSYGALVGKVSAASINDTEMFTITVTDSDPERATLIANTIADVLPERVEEIMNQSSMKVVDYAIVPSGRTGPNVTRYATIGILVGVIIACAIIVVLELLDDRIHDDQYLIQNYALPVLASIPDYSSGSRRGYYYKRRGYGYKYGYGYGYRRSHSYYAKASSSYAKAASAAKEDKK